MAGGFALPGFLERWKTEWIDPAFDYMEGGRPKTDSHLNDVSIEYPEDDVRAATRNFDPSCMLGSGTFGSVYRGTMVDGTEVAIKVLQVPEEAGFEEEVKVLSRFRHPNLVILMGFARHAETGGRSLIYEYLQGGDVSRRLQRSRQHQEPFEWKARLSASIDAACGLSHLHNMNPRAFHRDIKGPNILLDKNGTAKMADFGLSCVSSASQHKVQQASGTVGYACPEYIRSGIITEGSEVHSFGMVLLELLTGAPPAVQRPDKPTEFCYLVDHLQGSVAKVIQMLDPTSHFPLPLAQTLTEIAFRCITPNPAERPLFKQLVEELRHLMQHAEAPLNSSMGTSVLALGHARQQLPQQQQQQQQQQQECKATQVAGQQQASQTPAAAQPSQQQCHQSGVRRVVLAVGTAVEGRWRGGSGWFRGRIARVNANGTFAIKYNDGDFEDQMPAQHLRALDPPATAGGQVQQLSGNQNGSPAAAILDGVAPPPPPPPPAPQGQRTQGSRPAAEAAGGAAPSSEPPRAPLPSSRLWCVFAEGVELNKLKEQQRAITLPSSGQDLIVGRTAQPAALWDTLVPDRRLHGTVSREHFKVSTRWSVPGTGGAAEQAAFYLNCLSLNGVLLNGKYVAQNSGERRLQHGDVVAFAASVESPAATHANGNGPTARKPFIVFSFEVLNSGPAETSVGTAAAASVPSATVSPAAASSGPQVSTSPSAEDDEGLQLPEGSVAGRWRELGAGPSVPDDALFCLEVHGENVCMDLPSEARQLFFCCEPGATTLPTLRVGRHFQRGFWQRVVLPEVLTSGTWASIIAVDHFEVRSLRRSNPLTSEPPDWRFRLRVLGQAGVSVNYSTIKHIAGDERELNQGDALTVGGMSSATADREALHGLHFTFIPLQGATLLPERPRQLPEFESFKDADDLTDGLLASNHRMNSLPNALLASKACALKPPTSVSSLDQPEPDLGRSERTEARTLGTRVLGPQNCEVADRADVAAQGRHSSKTRILPPIYDEGASGDPDDLFSRTGFRPCAQSTT